MGFLFVALIFACSSLRGDLPSSLASVDLQLEQEHDAHSRPALLVEKAKLLYADQQRIEAQEVFLEALQLSSVDDAEASSEAERTLFLSLLPDYEASIQSKEGSERFSRCVEKQIVSHPTYASLEYYAAVSLANQNRMGEFFDRFFHAFGHRADCFLRWKTVGVLHVRLYEASSSEARREFHRTEAVRWLKEAFARQREDSALPAKILFVLRPSERKAFLQEIVASVAAMRTPMRRGDCCAIIAQAIELKETELAKQLIEKARTWYQYSRALDELSERLHSGTQE